MYTKKILLFFENEKSLLVYESGFHVPTIFLQNKKSEKCTNVLYFSYTKIIENQQYCYNKINNHEYMFQFLHYNR